METDYEEFLRLINQVENAETNDFCELALLLGRDPKTDFAGADLSYVELTGCDFSHADLSYTNLRGCNLTAANLRYSNLLGADLSNANLQGTDLAYANLTYCNLKNANLNSVDLSQVDLSVAHREDSQSQILDSANNDSQIKHDKLQHNTSCDVHDVMNLQLEFLQVKSNLKASASYRKDGAKPSLGRLTEFSDSRHEEIVINGPNTLSGEIEISGAKNSAIVLACASLLTTDTLLLKNVPYLGDIATMCHILGTLGADINYSITNSIEITIRQLNLDSPPSYLVNSLRASFFCIGPILARCGSVTMPLPGGCTIGSRPVVEHIKGLKALGATITVDHGCVKAYIPSQRRRLKGTRIQLEVPSVGATETLMMAAVLADGETIIENAALEPEICDLAGLLSAMGAKIRGGGSRTITINGVSKLHGAEYMIMPDRIEAGTYLIAAAITRSLIEVAPVIPNHLGAVLSTLEAIGCNLFVNKNRVRIEANRVHAVDIQTNPYPGYPTDLQAAMMVLNTTAFGSSTVTEQIFENRMQHVCELQRMGADIRTEGNTAFINGGTQLHGTLVWGTDLRGVAALILAGLSAEGQTSVRGLEFLDRGYVCMDEKLKKVGASIMRKSLKSDPVFANHLLPTI